MNIQRKLVRIKKTQPNVQAQTSLQSAQQANESTQVGQGQNPEKLDLENM